MSEPHFYTQPNPPKSSALKIILIIGGILAAGFSCLIFASIVTIGALTLLGSRVVPVTEGVSPAISASPLQETTTGPLPSITEHGIESIDKLFRITKPGIMQPTNSLTSLSNLQLANYEADQYLVIFANTAQSIHREGYNFAEYQELVATDLLNKLTNGSINNTTPVTIDGLSGTRYEISGQSIEREITYWITMLDGNETYYEIQAWTTNDSREKNRAPLLEASDSFELIR
jgi:hypothetical protein